MARAFRTVAVASSMLALAALGIYGYYLYEFPFGMDHCCDAQLWLALNRYADAHDGVFPAGQACPEASLCLLNGIDGEDYSYLLRGHAHSEEVAKAILDGGGLLGPETCGWHYVEGLRKGDDPHLALFWDKTSLGHTGKRLDEGGHVVCFLNGMRRQVTEADWPAFLSEQQSLLNNRKERPKGDAGDEAQPVETEHPTD